MKNYLSEGIFQKKSFLSFKDKKKIFSLIKNYSKKYINFGNFEDLEDQKLHDKLILLRKENPKKFGEMYDSINLNSSFRSLFYQDKFLKLFAKLLSTNISNIYLNNFMFRLDVPKDKRNILDWHQDSPYYHMSYPKYNCGFCWISITKNTKKNGTLIYIPKSHKKFIKEIDVIRGKNTMISRQLKIKITPKEKRNIEHLNSNFGDLNCFHMNIKHKSGYNSSKKIRISIICRFHDMNSGFNVGKEVFFFNKTGKSRLF